MKDNKKTISDLFDEGIGAIKSTSAQSKHPESCSSFVSLLFKAKEDIHIAHIEQRSKSLATHEALSIFYTSLDDLLDTFAETVMAIHGQLTISFQAANVTNPLDYMKKLYVQVEQAKKQYTEGWILNQIDEITQLIAHTIYKLNYVTAAPIQ